MADKVIVIKATKGNFINYCYIVFDDISKDAVIIDPAWEEEKFSFYINFHQLNLKGILLTHSHHDHIDLAQTMSKKYNIYTYISKIEFDYYSYSGNNIVLIDTETFFLCWEC